MLNVLTTIVSTRELNR